MQKPKNAGTTKEGRRRRAILRRAEKKGYHQNIEGLVWNTSNIILQHFFAKMNLKNDEGSFLAAMQTTIDRYLHNTNYEVD